MISATPSAELKARLPDAIALDDAGGFLYFHEQNPTTHLYARLYLASCTGFGHSARSTFVAYCRSDSVAAR